MGQVKTNRRSKYKKILIGNNFSDGLVFKFFIIILLISFSYIYLYPILFMFINSIKSLDDLLDSGVRWVPNKFYLENYLRAWKVIEMPGSIFESIWYVLKVSLFATATSALVGYGFATFNFPFKRILFALMLIAFILPPQVLMVALNGIYLKLGIVGTEYTMLLPAIFGQGLNQSIFILLFYQFFRQTPKVLLEQAEIDGASPFKVFTSIALPSATPSIIIVFLFSFVWYWNETFMTGLYTQTLPTIPLKISRFVSSYESLFPPGTAGNELNEAIKLAGQMLGILPLLILYFLLQKQFTESIDRTGIVGE